MLRKYEMSGRRGNGGMEKYKFTQKRFERNKSQLLKMESRPSVARNSLQCNGKDKLYKLDFLFTIIYEDFLSIRDIT